MNTMNPTTETRSKTRRSASQWQEVIDAYHASDLTQVEFFASKVSR